MTRQFKADPGQAGPGPYDEYQPVSWRQRLAIIALAIGTAIGVVLLLLYPPGGVVRKRAPAAAVPECAASDAAAGAAGCVGGKASVIMSPASGSTRRNER